MAYVLEALVFPATMPWPHRLHRLRLVGLAGSPELVMLPLTCEVQEWMGRAPDDEPVLGFLELVDPVRRFAAALSVDGPVVYLHAEITGGTGTQGSVGWRDGRVDFGPVLTANIEADLETPEYLLAEHITQGAINRALRHLGVRAAATAVDEFDTVGLGLHRDTDDWVDDEAR